MSNAPIKARRPTVLKLDLGVRLREALDLVQVQPTLVKPSALHRSLPTPWWTKNRPSGS